MENNLVFLILMVIFLGAAFYVPLLLTKRAMIKIIETFCRQNAVGVRNARTAGELGLRPPGLFGRGMMLYDYKPYALQALMQAGIVQSTEDAKLYMTEERLNENLRCTRLVFNRPIGG
jgi:hypothetical protein